MSQRPNLRVIDTATGEIHDSCQSCAELREELTGALVEKKSWRSKYYAAVADKDHEARTHELWDTAEKHFDLWRQECNHPSSEWGPDRFWLWLPFGSSKKYAPLIPAAIAGAKHDAWKRQRRNGSWKRFDEWERIFKDRGTFEEFVNRAPRRAA